MQLCFHRFRFYVWTGGGNDFNTLRVNKAYGKRTVQMTFW